MKWLKTHFLLLLFFCCTGLAQQIAAQKILILDKPGKIKRMRYNIGYPIQLKSISNQLVYDGILTNMYDSCVVVNGKEILFEDIETVYKSRRFFPKASYITRTVGVGYVCLEFVNNLINSRKLMDGQTLAFGGSLVATSYLFDWLKVRRFRVCKAWRLRIIELTGLPPELMPPK